MTEENEAGPLCFQKDRLEQFFRRCLRSLPHQYSEVDPSRLSALYFSVLGLDALGSPLMGRDREEVISAVYSLQVFSSSSSPSCHLANQAGFLGSSFLGLPYNTEGHDLDEISRWKDKSTSGVLGLSDHVQGHVAMTFTAVMILTALGDNLDRVNKASIVTALKGLQQPNGAFQATKSYGECDMRFLYCACAISSTLSNWTGIDTDLAVKYILSCLTYEGGISLVPGNEAHGGATYTAVASLVLMGKLDILTSEQRSSLVRWCLMRQQGGFNGRTNKNCDSCYSFWIGATLDLLGEFKTTDINSTRQFLLEKCQHHILGGFAKIPGSPPDILHSFYSLSWLSMACENGTKAIDTRLGLLAEKSKHIRNRASC